MTTDTVYLHRIYMHILSCRSPVNTDLLPLLRGRECIRLFPLFWSIVKIFKLGVHGGGNNNRKGGAEREHIIRRKAWKEIAAKCNKTYCPRVWLVLENNTPAAGRLQHITITTPSEFMVSGNQQKVSTLNHAAKGPARTS